MTYDEALAAAKEGKGIRRPHWHLGALAYWHQEFKQMWTNYGDRGWTAFDFDKEATDWEIAS